MQSKKVFTAFLAPALLALAVHTALAADDDGTFTINLQGPEEVAQTSQAPVANSAPATAPRTTQTTRIQNTRRNANQNRQNNTTRNNTTRNNTTSPITTLPAATPQRPVVTSSNTLQTQSEFTVAPQGTYNVGANDTLWSIATRYMPADRSVNEFQIAASIYRRNPNAFIGGNVNRLRAGRITIPALADMAREDERTGSTLLKQGSINLPSLAATPRGNQNVALSATSTSATSTSATSTANISNNNGAQNNANTLPSYQATENLVRNARLERQKELEDQARAEMNLAALGAQRGAQVAHDPVTNAAAQASRSASGEQISDHNVDQNAEQNNAPNAENSAEHNSAQGNEGNSAPQNLAKTSAKSNLDGAQETNTQDKTVELTPHVSAKNAEQDVDSKALQIMLEGAQKQIDMRMREINSRLMDTIERMQKSNDTVSSSTQAAVANLAKQYDGLIAELQQNVTELKGQVASLSRDMSNMREMLLASDEKIESLQVSLADGKFSNQQDKSNSYRTSYNYLVAGIGCLTLMLLILFLVVRSKSRARSRALQKDLSEIDASTVAHDEELISSTVGLDENEMQKNWSDALAEVEPDSTNDEAKKNASQAILEKAVKGDTALDSAEADVAVAAGEKLSASQTESENNEEKLKSDDENVAEKAQNDTNSTSSTEDAWAAALKEQSEAEQEQSHQETKAQDQKEETDQDENTNAQEVADSSIPNTDDSAVSKDEIENENKTSAEQEAVDDDLSKYIGASGSEWAQQVKEGEENDPNLPDPNQLHHANADDGEPHLKEQDLADAWAQALAQQNADTKNYDVEDEVSNTKSTEQAQGEETPNPKDEASVTAKVSDAHDDQDPQETEESEDSNTFAQVLNSLQSDDAGTDSDNSEEHNDIVQSVAPVSQAEHEISEDEKRLAKALDPLQDTDEIHALTEHYDPNEDSSYDSDNQDLQEESEQGSNAQDEASQEESQEHALSDSQAQLSANSAEETQNTVPSEVEHGADDENLAQSADEQTFAQVLKDLQAQSDESAEDYSADDVQEPSIKDDSSVQNSTVNSLDTEATPKAQEIAEPISKIEVANDTEPDSNNDSEDAQIFAHVRDLLSANENSKELESVHDDLKVPDEHHAVNDLLEKSSLDQVDPQLDAHAVNQEANREEAKSELASKEPSYEEHNEDEATFAQEHNAYDDPASSHEDHDSDQAIFSEVLNNLKEQGSADEPQYSSSTMADSYDPSWDESYSSNDEYADNEEPASTESLEENSFAERPQQAAERLFSSDFLSGLPSLDDDAQKAEHIEPASVQESDESENTAFDQTTLEQGTQDQTIQDRDNQDRDSQDQDSQEESQAQASFDESSSSQTRDTADLVSDHEAYTQENVSRLHTAKQDFANFLLNKDIEQEQNEQEERTYLQSQKEDAVASLQKADSNANKSVDEAYVEEQVEEPKDEHLEPQDTNDDAQYSGVAQTVAEQNGLLDEPQEAEPNTQKALLEPNESIEQTAAEPELSLRDENEPQTLSDDTQQEEYTKPSSTQGTSSKENADDKTQSSEDSETQVASSSNESLGDDLADDQVSKLSTNSLGENVNTKSEANLEPNVENDKHDKVVDSVRSEKDESQTALNALYQNNEQDFDSKAQLDTSKEVSLENAQSTELKVQDESVARAKAQPEETLDDNASYSGAQSPLLGSNVDEWNIPDEQEFGIDNTDENFSDADFKEAPALQDRELFSGNEPLQSIENKELAPDLLQEQEVKPNYSPFTWKVPDEEEFDVTSDEHHLVSKNDNESPKENTKEQNSFASENSQEVILPPLDETTDSINIKESASELSEQEPQGLGEHDIMNMLSEGVGEKELDDNVGKVDEAVAADVKSELGDDDILRMLSSSKEHEQEPNSHIQDRERS